MLYLFLILLAIILLQSFFNMIVWGNKKRITKKGFNQALQKTVLQILFGWCVLNHPFIKNTI